MADTSKITLGQLKTALTQAKNYTDNEIAGITGVSKVEPEELDMPKVFFYGNALPTTKDNVNLTMDYISNTTKFSSFVKLKCQGTSSMSYAKKNFTVTMYSDEARGTALKKDFKGWGAQSKFCLKANYVDTTHTRNLSGARIAYDMVNSRPSSEFKQQLLTTPRNGAVDGFPIKLYFNGEFYGIYTWNIPKDGWMFNMDGSNPNHMVLCAEQNNDGSNTSDNILRCEFRKEWDGTDGASWSIEFGTLTDALKNSFNRCVNFVMTATDEEFKANISEYFDLYSLLDYYCFSYLVAHIDGLGKNMLMVTYDGVIWGTCLYDMDSIYGAEWNGTSFKAANIQCPEQYQETNSLLWQRVENCFSAELYARYLELRQGALSLSNIIKHVEEIYDVIPDRVFADEKAKWTSLPGVNNNTMTRFRNYMRDRAEYVDAQMLEIGAKVPCTGIVLSADTLSFTESNAQTLSVVISPDNCTEAVTWSVSPTGVVSVDNGVVTPIANGSCTITATCGSYSDTCNVTVALPVVECTGITLDQNTLALGGNSGTGNSNLLSGVNNRISSNNIIFDAITLEPGVYEISNINEGTFTWLGYEINGRKYEPNGGSTNSVIFSIANTTDVTISAFINNSVTNTADKLALYKCILSNPQQFTQAGTGYFDKSGNVVASNSDIYTETISLDTTKKYATIYNGSNTITGSFIVTKYDNKVVNNPTPLITGQTIVIIENSSTVAISHDTTKCSLSDIQLVELNRPQETSLTNKAQLTATVTPENCTQPVVWSVSPEGIVTVNNGLVTAVTNGGATVTATCGTQTATCAVTVSGMSDISDGYIEYMIQYQSEESCSFALHPASTSTDCQGFECKPSFKGFAFPTDVNDTDTSYMICDSMPTVTDSEKKVNNIPCISGASDGTINFLTVKVLKTNASTVNEFETYFKENPTYIKIKVKDTVHKYTMNIDNVEMLTPTHSKNGYTCGEFIANDLPTTDYSASNVFVSNLGYSTDWSRGSDWSYFKITQWQGNIYVGFQIKNELLETQDLEGIKKYIAKDPFIYYIN